MNGKGWDTDISFTLNATDVHGIAYAYDARSYNFKADGSIGGGIAFAIVGDHENRPTDMTNLVVENHDEENTDREEIL